VKLWLRLQSRCRNGCLVFSSFRRLLSNSVVWPHHQLLSCYCVLSCRCGRFDDLNEVGGRRPSSQPAARSRDSVTKDLFTSSLSGMDDRNWLEMASGPTNKSASQVKGAVPDRPHSEGNVAEDVTNARNGDSFFWFLLLLILRVGRLLHY